MTTLLPVPLTTLSGAPASLSDYAGNVLLIVNVASKCGLTRQYTALEQLYQQFKDEGFVVLGFPANDFAGQEPGSDQEIATFCSTEYAVTFPIFSKIAANGPGRHPLYASLIDAQPEPIQNNPGFRAQIDGYLSSQGLPPTEPLPGILWNFEKFLVGKDGKVVARFAPDMTPDDSRVIKAVEQALAA